MAGEFWMTCDTVVTLAAASMRDLDTIDSELRLLAAVRRSIHEQGVWPSSRQGRRIAERATPASVQATANATERQRFCCLQICASALSMVTVCFRTTLASKTLGIDPALQK
jgi:hypothetical protein